MLWLAVVAVLAMVLLRWSNLAQASPNQPAPESGIPGGKAQGSKSAIRGLAASSSGRVPLSHRPPGALPGETGPSQAIFPPQTLTLRFNHRLHISEYGMGCTECHDEAPGSQSSADRLLPSPTRCDSCHGTNHTALGAVSNAGGKLIGECDFCHLRQGTSQIPRLVLPAPNLKFSHAAHVRRNIGCAQCHGSVEEVELATRDQLPRMRGCFRCHQMHGPARGEAHGECETCHFGNEEGRLRTEFSSGEMLPPRWLHASAHDPDWLERHKVVAAANSRFCGSCHSDDECTDCHDGRVRPRGIHPSDWLNMHAVAARQADCSSCHRAQSFCLPCHQRTGVSLAAPSENATARAGFHPPASLWTQAPAGPGHHAWEARRNLSACVSCHTERDCVRCHAEVGLGGRGGSGLSGGALNPHSPGFLQRCAEPLERNPRPCLTCHHPADGTLEACR